MARARALLSKRCGVPIVQILSDIEARQGTIAPPMASASATINRYAPNSPRRAIYTGTNGYDEEEDILREERDVSTQD